MCVQTLLGSDQSGKDSKKFSKNYGYIEFVVIPGTFNLDFPKNHDFDDLGKVMARR